MNGIAGLDAVDDLLGVAVDQSNLARVTQGDGEHVLEVDLVHLLGRTLVDRNDLLPARHHVLHAPLRRHVGRHLDVGGNVTDLVLRQDVVEVDHAAVGSIGDDLLEARLSELQRAAFGHLAVLVGLRPGRLQALSGGALTQHAVATGAALEVDLCRRFLGFLGERRRCRCGSFLGDCARRLQRKRERQPHDGASDR